MNNETSKIMFVACFLESFREFVEDLGDSRAFKICQGKNVKVFELDQETTQNLKIEALQKAGVEYNWVTFVLVNFEQESWVEKLTAHGFDPAQKTFFLWEGVMLYLTEETVTQMFHTVAQFKRKGWYYYL